MRPVIFLIFFVMSAPVAQQPARGTFEYRVDGVYEGEPMEPWAATTAVKDSAETFVIHHVVHRSIESRFEYHYVPKREAVWINEGRAGTTICRTPVQDEVPDFAVAFVAASLPVGTQPLTTLHCGPGGSIERKSIKVTIARDSTGWLVRASDEYPIQVVADRNRRVVKWIQPQGSVGHATYTLR